MEKNKADFCCCTCGRNKRVKNDDCNIDCICSIDGHKIGYLETFLTSCSRYVLDKVYKNGGKWYKQNNENQIVELEEVIICLKS